MPDRPTAADADYALLVVGDLWRALSEGDDLAVLQLNTSVVHRQTGTHDGVTARLAR